MATGEKEANHCQSWWWE